MTDGYFALLRFLIADYKDIGHLFKLRFADFFAEFLASDVAFRPVSAHNQIVAHLVCGVGGSVCQRQYAHLFGSHPKRERAVKLLDEHCKRALVAAYRTAVYNERTRLFAVFVDINHIETLGKREVELNGEQSVFLAVDVFALYVEFRSVERRFAPFFGVVELHIVKNLLHFIFGFFPILGGADVLVRIFGVPTRETVSDVFGKVENPHQISYEIRRFLELVLQLVGRAHDVPVGQSELTHADKSVHLAAGFFSEQRCRLCISYGQVAVRLQTVFVYRELEGTGHRTQTENFVVNVFFADIEHLVLVVLPVSRRNEQIVFGHNRRFGELITALLLLVLDEALQHLHYSRALRHKQRKSLPYVFVGHKQTEFSAESVVVAKFCLFHAFEIIFQLAFLLETGAVDTGKHLVFLVASPIRARERSELECFYSARGSEVRSAAKVDKIALLKEGNLLALGNIRKQFQLIILFYAFDGLFRFRTGRRNALNGHISLNNALHFRLDFFEIGLIYGSLELEIVIKTVLNCRSDCKLHCGIHILHRLRENVGAGVTISVSALLVRKGQHLERAVFVYNVV